MGTEKPSLSAAEVCLILEASAKAGARVLKFAGLEIEMGPKPLSPYLLHVGDSVPVAPTPAAAMAESTQIEQSRVSLEMDELQMREEQIAELLLTDPLAAEEMIRAGELEEIDGNDAE